MGNVIQEKGRRLQRSLNPTFPEDEHTHLKFSNGWLHRFQKRHKFKSFNSHGEVGDADHTGAGAALPELREFTSQYALNDVFNADEFRLFYTAASTNTIGPAPLPGKKMAKQRVTFFVCTNVDGTDRVQPLMIDKAERP